MNYAEINENLEALLAVDEGKRDPSEMLRKAKLAGDKQAVDWWTKVIANQQSRGKVGRPKVSTGGLDKLAFRQTYSTRLTKADIAADKATPDGGKAQIVLSKPKGKKPTERDKKMMKKFRVASFRKRNEETQMNYASINENLEAIVDMLDV